MVPDFLIKLSTLSNTNQTFGNKLIGIWLAISFLTPDLNIGFFYEIFQIEGNEHVTMIDQKSVR